MGAITAFHATFTIDSQFPVGTVTGSKQLSTTAPAGSSLAVFGSCDPESPRPPTTWSWGQQPEPVYTAQINATTGSRTDSGTPGLIIGRCRRLPR